MTLALRRLLVVLTVLLAGFAVTACSSSTAGTPDPVVPLEPAVTLDAIAFEAGPAPPMSTGNLPQLAVSSHSGVEPHASGPVTAARVDTLTST